MFSFAPKGGQKAAEAADMKEKVKEWQKDLKSEMRKVEHQIRDVNRGLEKVTRDAKELAKKNQAANVRTMAQHIVRGRQTVERLELAKAQINSIAMQLQEQYATTRLTGVLGDVNGIMKQISRLQKVPEVMATMSRFGEEMQRAGVMGEMIDDAMDSAMPVDMGEVDEVVQQVVFEVSGGAMGIAPGKTQLGQPKVAAGSATAAPARKAVAAGVGGVGGGAGDDSGAAGGGADNTEAMQALQDRFKKL